MVTVAEDYSASGLQRRRKLQDGSGVSPLWANDLVTGLYYERARWYSASLGTWILPDHLSYTNGANTYQFVMSNPVGNVDVAGLDIDIKHLGRHAMATLGHDVEFSLEVQSYGGGRHGWSHRGAARFVGNVMYSKYVLSAVELGGAKGALKIATKLIKIGAADSPEGMVGIALDITLKHLATALAKALWHELLALRQGAAAIETYPVFWQSHWANEWNTAGIVVHYNPFNGGFWGDITGAVGQINDAGWPNGIGCIHGFDYWFYGTVNDNGGIAQFHYPNAPHP
jgi:RHS repeat-associated protein